MSSSERVRRVVKPKRPSGTAKVDDPSQVTTVEVGDHWVVVEDEAAGSPGAGPEAHEATDDLPSTPAPPPHDA